MACTWTLIFLPLWDKVFLSSVAVSQCLLIRLKKCELLRSANSYMLMQRKWPYALARKKCAYCLLIRTVTYSKT